MRMIDILKRILGRKNPDQENLAYLLSHGMKLGRNSYINSGCKIDTGWPWLISIGDHVIIASDVTILAHDASLNMVGCGTKLGRVDIGNNVFIGSGSIVLCNTKIGDNVIVGAGSVISHNLPSNGVYAGVPARRLCSIEEYQDRCRKEKEKRPNFSSIHPWDRWREAPMEDKKQMVEALKDGNGFV